MNRKQAYDAMLSGKKVRHFNFSGEEYLHMVDQTIMTEDGYRFGDIFCNTDWMEDGWSIF